MKVGTRSVLFGYHAFWLHPVFVAWAWWKLYGFPYDPRLWVAFFVHDLGYWGKADMDGEEGRRHPEFGATVMHRLYDLGNEISAPNRWYNFCLYHSRDYAKRHSHPVSRLCVADKLAGCLCPVWLAIALTTLSGEIKEYMTRFKRKSKRDWGESYIVETLKWIELNYNEAEVNRSNRRSRNRGIANNRVS